MNTKHRTGFLGIMMVTAVLLGVLSGCGTEKKPEAETEQAVSTEAYSEQQTSVFSIEAEETVTQTETDETSTEAEMPSEEASEEPVTILGVYAGKVNEQKNSPDSYYPAASVTVPELELSEESAGLQPELSDALKKWAEELKNTSAQAMERLTQTYQEMEEASTAEEEDFGLCDETEVSVLRADSRVLSVRTYTYANYGGPHPDHYYRGANFDTETGIKLKLTDVVTDMEAFTGAVERKVREEYPDLTEYFFSTPEEALASADTENSNVAWNLEYEGIRLIFNPYCLGPYAMGEQIVTVLFSEMPEVFDGYYTKAPESWFMPLTDGIPTEADVSGNGKREEISVSYEPAAGEGDARNYTVSSGSRSVRLETWAYQADSYLLKSDGRYYVYLFATSDSDWVSLYTVDLGTMLPAENGPISAFVPLRRSDWKETDGGFIWSRAVIAMTDPAHFLLESRMDFLGTQDARRYYHAGENGAPVPETPYYFYENTTVLKVKQPLAADIVNEEGEVTGHTELSPGTCLFFVRTDDATYGDFQEVDAALVNAEETEWYSRYDTDGNNRVDWTAPVYRIRENKNNWPFTIDGTDEAEMLGGVNYAG